MGLLDSLFGKPKKQSPSASTLSDQQIRASDINAVFLVADERVIATLPTHDMQKVGLPRK